MLSPIQRTMLAELRRGEIVPTERIATAIYGGREDGGPDNPEAAVRRQIYKMRRKLSTVGVNIETVGVKRGAEGYRLRTESMTSMETLLGT